ncbi:MBL fold metallo-hydrolase [Natrialbaceae archaeon AArc-T1-2]|uniref:MBL fold metallo-hydrolase n=1 Tax=Natrialbaceae archaeon AArc-T1-2 TaxID=3053904 RepID=UPI00255B0213|nr:MBL fold metallo-hydrolase [Natrialbaceae archaeon AArc-T1-2]WIV67470.1 MBL fold metallo-hydrolase [Natrialbaceae archaeon AArc-T1-2]
MTVSYDAITVDWLGYATVRLEGRTGVVVYTDPGRYGVLEDYDARDGDLVLITHAHHYDPDGIRRVAHEDAIVLVHDAIDASEIDRVDERPEDLPYEIERVRADESFVLGPLDLFTTPAYNDPDGPHTRPDGTPHHPRGEGCGYGVTIDGVTAFWAGDTDVLAAHEELAIDVAMLPIGGAYTMDRHEAADLAAAMDPGLVVPIHYDTFAEIETDDEAFVVDVATRGVPVVLDR